MRSTIAGKIFAFLVEMGFHHVGRASLKHLTSSDPPITASQSAGNTGVSHCAQLVIRQKFLEGTKEVRVITKENSWAFPSPISGISQEAQ